MATIGLHHFNIRVTAEELVALRSFYVDVVGLNEGPRPSFKSAGTWLYAGLTPILHLTQMNSGETVAPGSPLALPEARDKRVSALDHVALACDDLEDALARLIRHDVSFTRSEVPAVREIQLFFRDPSGIGVELIFSSARAG